VVDGSAETPLEGMACSCLGGSADLDVMKMFDRTTDRFPLVKVHEEIQQ
jgi:hypothetical protein